MFLRRILAVAAVLVLAVPLLPSEQVEGQAAAPASRFGEAGLPVMDVFPAPTTLPGHNSAGEPSMGISWKTDNPMAIAGTRFYWMRFTDNADLSGAATLPTVQWEDRTPSNAPVFNLDPMLHTDSANGRVWAGGLAGATSMMMYSDNDGATWQGPVQPLSGGSGVDHQTIGSGPWVGANPGPLGNAVYGTYYCAQTGTIDCARSADGGATWTPVGKANVGGCSGLHGHLRVAPDGTAYLPIKNCGFARSTDNGNTWVAISVPGYDKKGTWDPSIGISTGGVIYFGSMQGDGAPHIAVSKDRGLNWESDLGTGNGGAGTDWFNVGELLGVKRAVFPDVQAGDDGRAVYGFLGSTVDAPTGSCGPSSDAHVWHYYMAFTYDFGRTWHAQQVTTHPVQHGGIWPNGGADPCRNLLDFNDLDIDSQGRVYAVFADGCTGTCDQPSESRDSHLTIVRQRTGCGLFSLYDEPGVDPECSMVFLPEGPEAAFQCTGDKETKSIRFIDESSEGEAEITERVWDFGSGDGDEAMTETDFERSYDAAGTYTVRLTVKDANDLSASAEKECEILANRPPAIHGIRDQTVREGRNMVLEPKYSDPDGDPLTFQLVTNGGLKNASFDTSTGRLEWTAITGTYNGIRILVTDGELWNELQFSIVVLPPGAEPPTPVGDSDGDGIADEADECPGQVECGSAGGDPQGAGPSTPGSTDRDGDGIVDASDPCPTIPYSGRDADRDGIPDECDLDVDGDRVPQVVRLPDVGDNCPWVPNPDQADADGDGLGDACDLAEGRSFAAPPPTTLPPFVPADSVKSQGRSAQALLAVGALGVLAGLALLVYSRRPFM